ncbi:MAG: hypothetical protein P8Y69_11895 [Gammaproteobacteria bacterium]|jgi:hypothetical protein
MVSNSPIGRPAYRDHSRTAEASDREIGVIDVYNNNNDGDLEREREVLTEAIRVLKKARKAETGAITSLADAVALLGGEIVHERPLTDENGGSVRERLSVVIDALAFHAGEICDKPETIHGVITLLSEIRHALDWRPENG